MSADSIRSPWFWLTALALALLALFVLYPLLSIVGGSFSGEGPSGWAQLVSTSKYREAVLNTLILASSVTVICTRPSITNAIRVGSSPFICSISPAP